MFSGKLENLMVRSEKIGFSLILKQKDTIESSFDIFGGFLKSGKNTFVFISFPSIYSLKTKCVFL